MIDKAGDPKQYVLTLIERTLNKEFSKKILDFVDRLTFQWSDNVVYAGVIYVLNHGSRRVTGIRVLLNKNNILHSQDLTVIFVIVHEIFHVALRCVQHTQHADSKQMMRFIEKWADRLLDKDLEQSRESVIEHTMYYSVELQVNFSSSIFLEQALRKDRRTAPEIELAVLNDIRTRLGSECADIFSQGLGVTYLKYLSKLLGNNLYDASARMRSLPRITAALAVMKKKINDLKTNAKTDKDAKNKTPGSFKLVARRVILGGVNNQTGDSCRGGKTDLDFDEEQGETGEPKGQWSGKSSEGIEHNHVGTPSDRGGEKGEARKNDQDSVSGVEVPEDAGPYDFGVLDLDDELGQSIKDILGDVKTQTHDDVGISTRCRVLECDNNGIAGLKWQRMRAVFVETVKQVTEKALGRWYYSESIWRPNRRDPSLTKKRSRVAHGSIAILLDVSSSIGDNRVSIITDMIKDSMLMFINENISARLIMFNAHVVSDIRLESESDVRNIKIFSGGGTNPQSAMDLVEGDATLDVAIVITDADFTHKPISRNKDFFKWIIVPELHGADSQKGEINARCHLEGYNYIVIK